MAAGACWTASAPPAASRSRPSVLRAKRAVRGRASGARACSRRRPGPRTPAGGARGRTSVRQSRLEDDPDFVRGKSRLARKNIDGAVLSFREALANNPGNAAAHFDALRERQMAVEALVLDRVAMLADG